MKVSCWPALALAGAALIAPLRGNTFADRVLDYRPGALPSNLAAYTNAVAVLGEPSRATPGQWGGPVDPFAPPYTSDQILALGTNGSLTVRFEAPVLDDPRHPFGLDLIVFGAAGFTIANGDYTGGGVTDGSLFGGGTGHPRLFVSEDGLRYWLLEPTPAADWATPWPTDGEGSFSRPLATGADPARCAGLGLAGLRRA